MLLNQGLLFVHLQLRFELSEGRAFDGWNEGAITFSPTYKYLPNSDEYCWHAQGRKGEKSRAPAWWDQWIIIPASDLDNWVERNVTCLLVFAGAIEYCGWARDWSKTDTSDASRSYQTTERCEQSSPRKSTSWSLWTLWMDSFCRITLMISLI